MIDLVCENDAWAEVLPNAEDIAAACYAAASAMEPALKGEIALLLTDDEGMRALNFRFREQDRPTNVLSFPADGRGEFVGDIALGLETCLHEASERNIAMKDHAAHLIVHGMLHLIGYDHQVDDEGEAMERREAAILAVLGVDDPYGLTPASARDRNAEKRT